jgi:hypothetical protein
LFLFEKLEVEKFSFMMPSSAGFVANEVSDYEVALPSILLELVHFFFASVVTQPNC